MTSRWKGTNLQTIANPKIQWLSRSCEATQTDKPVTTDKKWHATFEQAEKHDIHVTGIPVQQESMCR